LIFEFSSLEMAHEMEFMTADALFRIDIAFPQAKVAVEVDGPLHFSNNTRLPLGSTAIRRRLLEQSGWTVVSVPFFEWDPLASSKERQKYLTDKLKTSGVSPEELIGGGSEYIPF
jgi:hypothetical protein